LTKKQRKALKQLQLSASFGAQTATTRAAENSAVYQHSAVPAAGPTTSQQTAPEAAKAATTAPKQAAPMEVDNEIPRSKKGKPSRALPWVAACTVISMGLLAWTVIGIHHCGPVLQAGPHSESCKPPYTTRDSWLSVPLWHNSLQTCSNQDGCKPGIHHSGPVHSSLARQARTPLCSFPHGGMSYSWLSNLLWHNSLQTCSNQDGCKPGIHHSGPVHSSLARQARTPLCS
jgi:hypothetical protein